jgi:hypothetical protein
MAFLVFTGGVGQGQQQSQGHQEKRDGRYQEQSAKDLNRRQSESVQLPGAKRQNKHATSEAKGLSTSNIEVVCTNLAFQNTRDDRHGLAPFPAKVTSL